MATTRNQTYQLTLNGVTQAITNTAQLRTSIEQLEDQFEQSTFGSDEFRTLQRELQRANTEMERLDQAVERFTPEQRLETIGKLGESLAGAFGLATVAASTLGSSFGLSEEQVSKYQESVDKVLLGLQSYKSLLEGVTGENLKNLKSLIGVRLETIRQTIATNAASVSARLFGTAMRTAIASTGIGLFIVALVLIVENFDKIKRVAAPILDFLSDKISGLVNSARNLASVLSFGLINDAATAKSVANLEKIGNALTESLAKNTKAFTEYKAENEAIIGLLEKTGQKQGQIFELRKQQFAEEVSLLSQRQQLIDNALLSGKDEIKIGEETLTIEDANNKLLQEKIALEINYKGLILDRKKELLAQFQDESGYLEKIKLLNADYEDDKAKIRLRFARERLNNTAEFIGRESKEYRDQALEIVSLERDVLAKVKELRSQVQPINLAFPQAILTEQEKAFNAEIKRLQDLKYVSESYIDDLKKKAAESKLKINVELADFTVTEERKALTNIEKLKLKVKDALDDSADGDISFFDAFFGAGTTDNINSSLEAASAISQQLADANSERIDAQIKLIDDKINESKEKLTSLTQDFQTTIATIQGLEAQLLTARGTQREQIIQQLERERAKNAEIATAKANEDARIKKEEVIKIALEKKKQAEINRTNKINQVATAIQQSLAAVEALRVAIQAGSKGKFGFDNIALIVAATAAVAGAFLAIKKASSSLPKAERGRVIGGRRHSAGGTIIEAETGEVIINRKSSAMFSDLLSEINQAGGGIPLSIPKAEFGAVVQPNFSAINSAIPANSTAIDNTNQLILQQLERLNKTNVELADRPIYTSVVEIADTTSRVAEIKEYSLTN